MINKNFKLDDEGLLHIQTCIQQGVNSVNLALAPYTCIMAGTSTEINHQYIQEHNVKLLPIPYSGGCIIVAPGDVQIAYITSHVEDLFLQSFLSKFAGWLRGRGVNATLRNNDVVIDKNKKVACVAQNVFPNNMALKVIHVSINIDADLIANVCQKDTLKIPTGLSSYGITTEEVYNELYTEVQEMIDEDVIRL